MNRDVGARPVVSRSIIYTALVIHLFTHIHSNYTGYILGGCVHMSCFHPYHLLRLLVIIEVDVF